jgi:hypothetical protein
MTGNGKIGSNGIYASDSVEERSETDLYYIYIYMDLRLATLKAVSLYFLHNVSTLNQCRTFSCGTVVCKHFGSYQDHPNYKWDLIR